MKCEQWQTMEGVDTRRYERVILGHTFLACMHTASSTAIQALCKGGVEKHKRTTGGHVQNCLAMQHVSLLLLLKLWIQIFLFQCACIDRFCMLCL
jgi:hypothetical protein